jgi:hypothetical protein
MSDEDPFKPKETDPFRRRDTRPFLGKTDRRESLRSDVPCILHVEGAEPVETIGNVSLTGCLVAPGVLEGPALEDKVRVEITVDPRKPFELEGTMSPPPGKREGRFVRFPELDFDTERTLARLLDNTSDFDEPSIKPDG